MSKLSINWQDAGDLWTFTTVKGTYSINGASNNEFYLDFLANDGAVTDLGCHLSLKNAQLTAGKHAIQVGKITKEAT
jgi:hypothetical protein